MENANHAIILLENMKRRPRDFTIKAGNRSFPVHRNFVTASSPYFDSMLESGMKEAEEGCVVLQGVEENAVETCVNFMYSGEAEITLANVKGVLHAADMMQLTVLANKCEEFLKNNLNPRICLEAIRLGRLYNRDALVLHTENYATENFPDVILSEDYLQMDCGDLERFLEKIPFDHEVKWKAITTWLTGADNECEESIAKLASAAKVANFPLQFLCREVCPEEILTKSTAATEMLLNGLFSDEKAFERNIEVGNCFVLKDFSEKYGVQNLISILELVKKFMAENFKSIAKDSRFCNLSVDEVGYLLAAKDTTATERTKALASLRWAKHKETRADTFPDLFERIRIQEIPRDILLKVFGSENLVMGSPRCKDHMLKSLLLPRDRKGSVNELLEVISEEPCIFTYDAASGNVKVLLISSRCEYSLPKVRPLYSQAPSAGGQQHPNDPSMKAIRYEDGKLKLFYAQSWYALNSDGSWISSQSTESFNLTKESVGSHVTSYSRFDDAIGDNYTVAIRWRQEESRVTQKRYKNVTTTITMLNKGQTIQSDFSGWRGMFIEVNKSLFFISGSDARKYCEDTEKWIQISSCKSRHSALAACVVVAGRLYVVGGDEDGLQDSIEVYDEQSDAWSTFHTMKKPAYGYLSAFGHTPQLD